MIMKHRLLPLVLFILIFTTGTLLASQSSSFGIYDLSCEQRVNPVGVSKPNPRFSWKISSSRRGFTQKAYQILIADSEELLKNREGNIWDSGRQKSSNSLLNPSVGAKLSSSTRYFWCVKVWGDNNESVWSSCGEFVTGVLDAHVWDGAEWIALERDSEEKTLRPGVHQPLVQSTIGDRMIGDYKLPIFRKKLSLEDKEIVSAVVNISGLGHFDLFIDGDKVGDNFLDPGWSAYDKSALYVTFDVTSKIEKGSLLGVMLGNGFYNIPRERYYKELASYGAPKVKMVLEIVYRDGSRERVVTDESWRVAKGPVGYSSIYGGEDYDASTGLCNWAQRGFDDSLWMSAVVVDSDVLLRSQESDPLYIRDRLPVVRKYQNGRGNWIFDFGQNMSGVVSLKTKGERAAELKITPGELLNSDSTVNQDATGAPYFWSYRLSGEGEEQWHPQFTYYGFRYIEVEGVDLVEELDFEALHTTNSAPEVGSFSCSNQMFNKSYELIDWSIRSNLASVITDCPHREKLGWLEVAHLMQYSMQYRYQLSSLYRKVMGDISESQTESGVVPTIVPEYVRFEGGFEDSPEWGSSGVIVPWYIYKWYGDSSLMVDYYDNMKRYVDYLSTRAKDYIVSYGLGDWFDIGPNTPGYAQLTSKGVTATAMYYYNSTIMSKVAALCGKDDDKIYYEELAAKVKEAYNREFYNEQSFNYDRNSQTANAISLYFGLVESQNVEKVYDALLDGLEKCGYALTAGDIGYRYLLRVLEDHGDSEVIYKMNRRYDVPGYGWQLAYGATSLTESWQCYGFVSNNHCMLGHLMEWFFSGLGGIGQQDSSIAFKKVKVMPQMVEGVSSASTSYDSPYGEVSCDWQKSNGSCRVKVSIPANAEGVVYLPTSDISNVVEGGRAIEDVEECSISDLHQEGYVILNVLSGDYIFDIKESF